MSLPKHEITICVCTFRRPRFLKRLLEHLQGQHCDDLYSLNIVVVDNDAMGSAWPVVKESLSISSIPIKYFHEPERSISLARNRSVANARGDLIAFIDDDEFPDIGWLVSLVRCYDRYGVDGVLGPVQPHFETTPPRWVIRGGLCKRPTHATGTIIGPKDMRTGNALLKHELFYEDDMPFDPKWGTIGGGDKDFFERMVARGRTFVWCNEGIVFETVPPERLNRSYFIRRALVRGLGNAKKSRLFSTPTAKSLLASIVYTLLLPWALIVGQHVFMKILISECDHIGRLLGLLGIEPVKERPYACLNDYPPYKTGSVGLPRISDSHETPDNLSPTGK